MLAPNSEGAGEEDVAPKRFEVVDVPKGEEENDGADEDPNPAPKLGVLAAKGFETVVDVKGLEDA